MKGCDLFIGDAARIPWPAATWEPRGDYDAFVVEPPESEWMYQGVQEAWTLAHHRVGGVDDLFIHLRHGGVHQGDERILFARILRVRDLETVGVLASRYDDPHEIVCLDGSYRESALDVHYDGTIDPFYARFHPDTGEWTFVPLNNLAGGYAFDIEAPWRELSSATGGFLRLDMQSGLWQEIRSNVAWRAAGSLGDTGVWTEDDEIWGIRGEGAPAQFASGGQRHPCSLGISQDWVFGFGSESDRCDDILTHARPWRAKRLSNGDLGPIELGPLLPPMAFHTFAHGWGDYGVISAFEYSNAEILVLRLSDWTVWRLNQTSDVDYHPDVWGVDGEYLYVGSGPFNLDLVELRRFPLGNLDAVATRVDFP